MKNLVCAAMLAALGSQAAYAQDTGPRDFEVVERQDKAGLRIEARANYETPTVSSTFEDGDVYKLGSAVSFGGEAGFDIAVSDNFVVGPYVQYEVSNVENCEDGFCARTTDWFSGGLQLGYATGTNGLLYGKIGYGRLSFETEGTVDGVNLDTTEDGSGVAFALGYEFGFSEHLYGRVEGGYADVGKVFGLNFQRRHAGVALGARF